MPRTFLFGSHACRHDTPSALVAAAPARHTLHIFAPRQRLTRCNTHSASRLQALESHRYSDANDCRHNNITLLNKIGAVLKDPKQLIKPKVIFARPSLVCYRTTHTLFADCESLSTAFYAMLYSAAMHIVDSVDIGICCQSFHARRTCGAFFHAQHRTSKRPTLAGTLPSTSPPSISTHHDNTTMFNKRARSAYNPVSALTTARPIPLPVCAAIPSLTRLRDRV